MYWQPDEWSQPRLLLLGGTRSERRRAFLNEDGSLSFRHRDPSGVKIMDVAMSDGSKLRTPYGLKAVATRRRRNKIAKQARKVNR
jgi:hypothetical protein